MIAVSVDYRLRERDNIQVPLECVKDAKSAVRYLRKNAQALKVDPNKIVAEAIAANRIGKLKGYASLKREQKYGKASRIAILLEDEGKGRAYVEIKHVHLMRQPGLAEFPDSVTARGVKHLEELGDMAEDGHRAVMMFLVQRSDATR